MLETKGKKNLRKFWKIILIFPIKKNFNEIKFNRKQRKIPSCSILTQDEMTQWK